MAAISEEQPAVTEEQARRRGPGRPFLPGQSGNPAGRPRRLLALEAQIRELHGPKALDVVEKLHGLAIAGNVAAAKLYLDRVLGPMKAADPIRLAEHFRGVERDRIDIFLRALGNRIASWDSEKIGAALKDFERDLHAFLFAAENYLGATDTETEPGSPGHGESVGSDAASGG